MEDLSSTLESYGADRNGLRLLDAEEPGLLPYATLVAARDQGNQDLRPLLGVYEWQSSPLVFLVHEDGIQDGDHFQRIRRCVALRGDAPYLGVFRPGHLTIHRIALDAEGQAASRLHDLPHPKEKRATFAYLANSRPEAAQRQWISQVVLNLLQETISTLQQHGITDYDAISLAGRALFVRFLGDRNLLPPALGPVSGLFDDAISTARTSRVLDDIFNGDFLPLSDGLFATLPAAAFHTLGNILHRAPGGQLSLGWQEKWEYLDFAHIPVGVLSEAYEHYMREHNPSQQRREGSYYTPHTLADLTVRGAFLALRRDGMTHQAMVLDPAAGAGVFLVSAFRQLVAERWLYDEKRPDTQTLREILYGQIVGFDINEAALRFAALGLYLMSIELDPEPEPLEKLRFKKNLRGIVLYSLRNGAPRGLGSLGQKVGAEHVGRYDLVIGNPPWTSSTRLPDWPEVKDIVTHIARKRLPQDTTPPPPLPNEGQDLPFVWRAMEWARPGGQIAFVLHGRLLFQQADGMAQARSALFRALDVSGVLNGAELRHTRVWPEVSAPFCLLFARNQLPSPGSAFRFVSPHVEEGLNGAGALRVDAANAEWVTPGQVAERPEVLKILFRGSTLDLEIFDRMAARDLIPLEQYWRDQFGEYRGRARQAGNGYQKLRSSSRVRKNGDSQPGVPADYLADLPELTAAAMAGILVDAAKLGEFKQPRIHDPRPRALFQAPLLIVHKSPPSGIGRIRLSVSDSDMVFNTTYYGYSAHEHSHGMLLVRYLALLVGSKPALWYTLMSSGAFGVERDVVEKIIIDRIPVRPLDSLSPDIWGQITPLFDALAQRDSPAHWAAVDAWAAALYGLREPDLQVINDTLRFNLPFASNRKAAQKPPAQDEVRAFCEALENELKLWAAREAHTITAQPVILGGHSPWTVVLVRSAAASSGQDQQLAIDDWPEVLRIADSLAATEVIYPDPATNCLWVARLNQARYWSCSQARLVARLVVWEHLETLFGSPAE